jgi:hypothetical protein
MASMSDVSMETFENIKSYLLNKTVLKDEVLQRFTFYLAFHVKDAGLQHLAMRLLQQGQAQLRELRGRVDAAQTELQLCCGSALWGQQRRPRDALVVRQANTLQRVLTNQSRILGLPVLDRAQLMDQLSQHEAAIMAQGVPLHEAIAAAANAAQAAANPDGN